MFVRFIVHLHGESCQYKPGRDGRWWRGGGGAGGGRWHGRGTQKKEEGEEGWMSGEGGKGGRRIPCECTVLDMLAQLILPLLQQVGWHDNQGGLDGHSLPFIMLLLLQVLNRPGGRRGVGQDEHEAL